MKKCLRKHPQINHVEETGDVKWCVFKVSPNMSKASQFCISVKGIYVSKQIKHLYKRILWLKQVEYVLLQNEYMNASHPRSAYALCQRL